VGGDGVGAAVVWRKKRTAAARSQGVGRVVSGPRGDEKERYAYIEDTILLATIIHILGGRGAGGTGMWWTEEGGESGGPQEGNPINPSVAAPRANPPP